MRTFPILLSALALTGSLACNRGYIAPKEPADQAPAPKVGAVEFATLAQRSVPAGAGGALRQVIRDEAAWREAWKQLGAAGRDGSAEPPTVDFGRDMVILVALETQSCISKVTVRGITRTGEGLSVDLLEQPPSPRCVCVVSERPYHAVRLAKTDEAVSFTAEQGRVEC